MGFTDRATDIFSTEDVFGIYQHDVRWIVDLFLNHFASLLKQNNRSSSDLVCRKQRINATRKIQDADAKRLLRAGERPLDRWTLSWWLFAVNFNLLIVHMLYYYLLLSIIFIIISYLQLILIFIIYYILIIFMVSLSRYKATLLARHGRLASEHVHRLLGRFGNQTFGEFREVNSSKPMDAATSN